MTIDEKIDAMTVAEKIRLLERVWASLCQNTVEFPSQEWHREILEQRARRLSEGHATVSSWTESRTRLQNLGK
jgi:putative addiction module component (TIGR02574 family)